MAKQTELPWVAEARKWIGTKEIAGIKHNPKIVGIWPAIGISWFKDDETPWCAGAVTLWCKQSGVCLPAPKNPAAALSYLTYGTTLDKPAYGALAVKERKGGGHVTIIVGQDIMGNLACLGANQDDQVKISFYSRTAFKTYRWPTGRVPNAERYQLPLLLSDGSASPHEA